MKRASPLATLAFLAAIIAPASSKAYDKTLDLPVEPNSSLEEKVQDAPPPEDGEEKPPTFYGQPIKSENNTIFYVLDMSGSMMLDESEYQEIDKDGNVTVKKGNRLDRAKAEMSKSISALPEKFKFNALAYDCSSIMWRAKLEEANNPNKQDAISWTYAIQPGGGTGTGTACALALNEKEVKFVVLLTDGAPNCDLGSITGGNPDHEAHRRTIRTANTQGAVVNVYGIGAYGDFKKFCQNVAGDNNGTYTDVR